MKLPMTTRLLGLGVLVTLAACGGEKPTQTGATSDDAAPAAASAAAPAAATATGNVIEVKMHTDDQGNNRFEPEHVTAKRGDVVRVVLESGVHNFHIHEGPSGVALPGPGQFLQLPGQTEDHLLDLPAGAYKFQCDPHAALGMVGTLTITE